jgi:hypothetical protein
MSNAFVAEEVSPKRGIGSVAEAVPSLLSGAKLTFTVPVPGAGRFCEVFEINATKAVMVAFSGTFGSEFIVS